MAQVNITHFTAISVDESKKISRLAQEAAALEVHGVQKDAIEPDTVTVMVVNVDREASLSGADTEIQVSVSGNNWPVKEGRPATYAEAKVHFDIMAAKIYKMITQDTKRVVYVWVTPFVASGWAE